MTRERFNGIWLPRLGMGGADELWGFRRASMRAAVGVPVFAGAAGVLAGSGILGDFGAAVSALGAASLWLDVVRRRATLKRLMSERFGVRVRGFPMMSPAAFDRWVRARGYRQPTT